LSRTYRPRACADCTAEFVPTGGKAKRCADCQATFSREYHRQKEAERRLKHPDRLRNYRESNREALRWYSRGRAYGLTAAEAQALVSSGVCDLCGRATENLHIDHDHATGAIRGVLCQSCNTGLGKLGDTVAGLERALAYLRAAQPAAA
jgi:hypothetical protein